MRIPILLLTAVFCLFATLAPSAAQTSADISGKWHFVLQTSDGDRTYDPTFTVDGENVGGKWERADVKGTFIDGKLKLEFPANSDEVGAGILKIMGQLETGQLTGTWSFQTYDGKFKATRAK